jgi:hypothetical protein
VADEDPSSLLPPVRLFGDRKATRAAVRHKHGRGPSGTASRTADPFESAGVRFVRTSKPFGDGSSNDSTDGRSGPITVMAIGVPRSRR